MSKRQTKVWQIILACLLFIAFTGLNIYVTLRIISMSGDELFENLIGTFVILEDFHPSVAIFLALFSLSVVWIAWLAIVVMSTILIFRWFKEKRNDT